MARKRLLLIRQRGVETSLLTQLMALEHEVHLTSFDAPSRDDDLRNLAPDVILVEAGAEKDERLRDFLVWLEAIGESLVVVCASDCEVPAGVVLHSPFTKSRLEAALALAIDGRGREAVRGAPVDNVVHAIADCMTIVDEEGVVIWGNAVCHQRLGRDPIGLRFDELYRPTGEHSHNLIALVIEEGVEREMEMVCAFPGTTPAIFLVKGSIAESGGKTQVITVARDITEMRRESEERARIQHRLQTIERIESLEVLAGGVAHDFNNLLQAILGSIALASASLPQEHSVQADLKLAREASLRASELTNEMLVFAGHQPYRSEKVALSIFLKELMESAMGAEFQRLRLHTYHAQPAYVRADGALLKRLILSLVRNALEASYEDQARVDVSVYEVVATKETLANYLPQDSLRPGLYACLEVSDKGCGISDETRRKMFDPFFSTKFVGRGLGLATSLGIVRTHQGGILVDSEIGKGTVIKVILPLVSKDSLTPATGAPAVVGDSSILPSVRSVLAIDDDAVVLHVLSRHLELQGYRVYQSSDPDEGLSLFWEHVDEISAVLLDLVMPHRDGVSLAREIRTHFPDLPVVLMSGYAKDDVQMRLDKIPGGCHFLQKPYEATTLAEILNHAILGIEED